MNTNTQIPEGSTTEPITIIPKMDTSLDHALHKNNETSFLSPCSTSSDVPNSDRGCQHTKLVAQDSYDTCFNCGAFVSKTGSRTFKSKNMSYVAFFPPKTIYETMIRRSSLFKQSMNPEYSHIRQTYVEWVLELADKLKMSTKSAHLGVLLLDTIMYKDTSLTSRLQVYAPVCLLIAAKTIELDERIPFIPKLRRYANPTFSVDDYRKAELLVLDMVDWNANFSTALEINEFLMCQGVLFSSDEIEENIEIEKMTPEALRENTQHGNTNHLEAKVDEKKDINKDTDKTLSPGSKENNENTCSEPSTATTEGHSQLVPQEGEDVSPAMKQTPLLLKHHSTPATFETNMSSRRAVAPIEKKAGDIMTHLETSYTKLTTMLLKDIDFTEFEPRVVAASTMAFFRCVNKVTPIWNPELETITQLRFSQISSCFDLIYKRYNNAFNRNSNKTLNVLSTPDSQKELLDLKITRTTSLNVEKYSIPPQPRAELTNKATAIANAYSTRFSIGGNESSIPAERKTFERKSIFEYQPKTTIPAANPTTASSYNYMRDDLRLRSKYVNGTANAEIPARNISRHSNFPSTYLTARFNAGHESASNYYTSGANSSFCTATGASYPAAGNLIDSSYVRSEAYSSRNSSIPYLNYKADGSYENVLPSYQSKLGVLKK